MRLDKYICDALGVTRNEAKKLIRGGAVTVDGVPAGSPEMKTDESSLIFVHGRQVLREEFVYFMMNKPAGVVCSTKDPLDMTVTDLLRQALPENDPLLKRDLFPAGRLDKDSTGLVLLTDDGAFAHRILSPARHVEKRYLVEVDAPIDGETVEAFKNGVTLSDGTRLRPADLAVVRPYSPETCTACAQVVIRQGVYHQIKRMFGACGIGVCSLRRVQIGGLALDPELAPGEFKKLTPGEALLAERH